MISPEFISPSPKEKPDQSQTAPTASIDELASQLIAQAHEACNQLNLARAEKFAQEAVLMVDRLPSWHTMRVSVREAASNVLVSVGDINGAVSLLQQALQLRVSQVSGSDYEVLDLRCRLGDLLLNAERPDEARSVFASMLEQGMSCSEGYLMRFRLQFGLARVALVTKDAAEYTRLMRQIYYDYRDVAASSPVSMMSLFNNEACKQLELGYFNEAQLLSTTALDLLEGVQFDVTKTRSQLWTNVARAAELAGNFDTAMSYRRKIIVQNRAQYGDEHPETCNARAFLALTLLEQGNFEVSEAMLSENLEHARDAQDFQRISEALEKLTRLNDERGLYKEAASLLEEALQYSEQVSKEKVVKLLVDSAVNCAMRYQHDQAYKMLEQALEVAKEIQGVDGLYLQINVLNQMVVALSRYDIEQARELFDQAQSILEQLPPGVNSYVLLGLKNANTSIAIAEGTPSEALEAIKNSLDDCRNKFGQTQCASRAVLLFELARQQFSLGEEEAGIVALKEAQKLLQDRKRNSTLIYGLVIQELAEHLPFHSHESEDLNNEATRIFKRYREQLDDEDLPS